MRLKAIKNIGKITKSMKMIAATKMNRAQKAMEVGRKYGQTTCSMYWWCQSVSKAQACFNGWKCHKGRHPPKRKYRGLCGAIHSSVAKVARRLAREQPDRTSIVVLGDKAKPQIARDARRNIVLSFNQVGKNIPTFLDALSIMQTVRGAVSLDNTLLIYNRFVSVIAYDTTLVTLPAVKDLKAAPRLTAYEVDDEVLEHYVDFANTTRLFWALVEGHAAEMAAKRSAMENATKNSEEIVGVLTMKYNRTRQAVITNELVDIITGASAL